MYCVRNLPKRPLARPEPPPRRGIRPSLFYGLFALLFLTNAVSGLALFMSPDISALIEGRQAKIIAGYLDRIDQLRLEVDRLHSRQYAQTGDINLQLQQLAQQQEILTEQHQYVKALIDKASSLGIVPEPADKTEPAAEGADTATAQPAAYSDTKGVARADVTRIEAVGHQIRKMMDESHLALAELSAGAEDATDEILAQLKQVDVTPDLPDAATDGDAIGGPLLPPLADSDDGADGTAVVDDANRVLLALARFKAARDALATVPILKPVASTRISSPFGNRRDPFTRRLALHPGIDFPDPRGTIVHAAADGKVIYAAWMSGYGNLVEIDHGNGYVSRYGHLSAFLVQPGDEVEAGDPVGKVGSTGRSTGPHVHFELRLDDRPINPAPFLAIGRRLSRFIKAAEARADYASPDAA